MRDGAMIEFFCDLSQIGTPFPHCWEHTVGSCHAPLALRSDWQAQLEQCHRELGFQYVRFHGLLSDDLGTLVRQQDALLDSFFNTDQIRLQEASRVTHEARSFEHADAACRFDVTIPPHAIAAITLEF